MADVEAGNDFLLGTNYWPSDKAMWLWERFDGDGVRRDFEALSSAEIDCVRVFAMWEAFQPEATRVSQGSLDNLRVVLDHAADLEMRVQVTLFTGHMSGANWLPPFATESTDDPDARFVTITEGRSGARKALNPFHDDALLAAQELLATETSRAIGDHTALWSWDLGNETSNVAQPEDPDGLRRWGVRMVNAIRTGGSDHPVTLGMHMEDLEENRNFRPGVAAEFCDFLCMHGYSFYSDWARAPLDPAVVPFLADVTRWLGGGRPVLFQEVGVPTSGSPSPGNGSRRPVFGESEGLGYTKDCLVALQRAGHSGAFAWTAFDYVEELWDREPLKSNPHENHFGLFSSDRRPKRVLTAWRNEESSVRAKGEEWIDISVEDYWKAPKRELVRLYGRYLRAGGDSLLGA